MRGSEMSLSPDVVVLLPSTGRSEVGIVLAIPLSLLATCAPSIASLPAMEGLYPANLSKPNQDEVLCSQLKSPRSTHCRIYSHLKVRVAAALPVAHLKPAERGHLGTDLVELGLVELHTAES